MPDVLRRLDPPDEVRTQPTADSRARRDSADDRIVRRARSLSSSPMIGGRYRVGTLLGCGGMGEVLAARDEILGRQVAIKRTRLVDRDGRFGRRLRREARIAARVAHRAVVSIYDLVYEQGNEHLVMEHVGGPSLADYEEDVPFEPSEVVRIGIELAEGLAAIHDAGIVHLDVKLENVLVTVGGQPKLSDFGSARCPDEALVDDDEEDVSGTPRAMSPEQIRGGVIDARSDLYSLGVLLFELATATSPFIGDSPVDTLARVLVERSPRVDERVAGVPPTLVQLIADLLEKDAQVRPATAGEVLTRLWAVVNELG
ncbi:MAG: serine/threonine protein kinase [Deltaproteobacteria bacterium]|nr:serine/threonine protein kinase [Deltaproteobacteria bacterium]